MHNSLVYENIESAVTKDGFFYQTQKYNGQLLSSWPEVKKKITKKPPKT